MNQFIQEIKHRFRQNQALFKLKKILEGKSEQLLWSDYPLHLQPRYGYGKSGYGPLLHIFKKHRQEYADLLNRCIPFIPRLVTLPFWENGWFPGLDMVVLYCLMAFKKPKKYLEVGSGISTLVAHQSVKDNHLKTRIISIDPRPREEIDSICDQVIRIGLEDVDQVIFSKLNEGDILFIDGSHQVLMNSDVLVLFLEIIPKLKPGVIVHLHDIYWPNDYPLVAAPLFYSEQYLLAQYLMLAEGTKCRVIMPNAFVSEDKKLMSILNPLWIRLSNRNMNKKGGSFWLEIL